MRLTILSSVPIGFFLGSIVVPYFVTGSTTPTYSECGGEYDDQRGIIRYKQSVFAEDYERCVWRIAAPNGVTYRVNYDATEIHSMDYSNGLTVVCLSPGENFDDTMRTYQLKRRGGFTLNANCPVVILTFYTGPFSEHTDSKGFYFEWQAVAGSPPFYSSNSKHHVATTGMMSHIRHPGWGQVYSNNELSTFIFVPQNNEKQNDLRTLVTLVPEDDDTGVHCQDRFYVYKFCGNGTYNRYFSSLTDGVCNPQVWYAQDILMFIFRSDTSNVGNGFRLIYRSLDVLQSRCTHT